MKEETNKQIQELKTTIDSLRKENNRLLDLVESLEQQINFFLFKENK